MSNYKENMFCFKCKTYSQKIAISIHWWIVVTNCGHT